MSNSTQTSIADDIRQLRERVRADRRTVIAPLVVFGALILTRLVVDLLAAGLTGSAGLHATVLLYWPVAGAVGLLVLWGHAHRLAEREGVGEGPRSYRPVTLGYVVSLPLIALLFLPALLVGVWASLVWPAAILFAVAIRQHSRTLSTVARGLGLAGVLEAFLAAVQTGPGPAGAWAVLALQGAAGASLVVGALVTARRSPAA